MKNICEYQQIYASIIQNIREYQQRTRKEVEKVIDGVLHAKPHDDPEARR